MKKGDGKKGLAFKALGLALFVAAAVYAGSAIRDVFARSSASVANTTWLSFESGKLTFYEKEGRWNKSDGVMAFSFAESQGIVTASSAGTAYYFVRIGEKELTAEKGTVTFYLYEKSSSRQ